MEGRLANKDEGGRELVGDVTPSGRPPGPLTFPVPVPGRRIEGSGAGPWDSWIDGSGLSFLGGEYPGVYEAPAASLPLALGALDFFRCCNLSCGGSLDGLRSSCGGPDAKNVISR